MLNMTGTLQLLYFTDTKTNASHQLNWSIYSKWEEGDIAGVFIMGSTDAPGGNLRGNKLR